MSNKVTITISEQNNDILLNLLRVLVDGKDNTKEFLSLARQYLELAVPRYEDIIELYKEIISGTKVSS